MQPHLFNKNRKCKEGREAYPLCCKLLTFLATNNNTRAIHKGDWFQKFLVSLFLGLFCLCRDLISIFLKWISLSFIMLRYHAQWNLRINSLQICIQTNTQAHICIYLSRDCKNSCAKYVNLNKLEIQLSQIVHFPVFILTSIRLSFFFFFSCFSFLLDIVFFFLAFFLFVSLFYSLFLSFKIFLSSPIPQNHSLSFQLLFSSYPLMVYFFSSFTSRLFSTLALHNSYFRALIKLKFVYAVL